MSGMTCDHNDARQNVNPPANPAIPPLTWDNTLATAAQLWADTCQFAHSGNGYGENIAAFGGGTGTPQAVVSMWVGESDCYDYASNFCDVGCQTNVDSCLHYTQVVWRGSERLGCGMKTCTTGSPFPGVPNWTVWVCNYDPPGNSGGQRPY